MGVIYLVAEHKEDDFKLLRDLFVGSGGRFADGIPGKVKDFFVVIFMGELGKWMRGIRWSCVV